MGVLVVVGVKLWLGVGVAVWLGLRVGVIV